MRPIVAFCLVFICACVGQEYQLNTDLSEIPEERAAISDMVMAFVVGAIYCLIHLFLLST